ncbi:hypothetical protein [Halorarum salinum]|uniref:Uncharacterized protein n=1 Tax=Halorarum salinum TaxID=2743089 RepID=A0A7D5QDZ5_9EURY|nr:hypothetical protein [Halobaculum salinum]QLG63660.1 hypothetical protein HUG12_18760 [Halobaculum salinum]
MLGAYAVGKKAVKFGYKRYGVPGAVASGGVALAGYLVVRRALRSSTDSEDVDSAIDVGTIKSAVEEGGLGAVTDRGTLDDAIDENELGTSIDVEEVQSSAEDEADEVRDGDGTSGET